MCTTELGAVAALIPEFQKRDAKVIALSCDPVDSHKGWIKDIQVAGGKGPCEYQSFQLLSGSECAEVYLIVLFVHLTMC